MKIEEGSVEVLIAEGFETLDSNVPREDKNPCYLPPSGGPIWEWMQEFNEEYETNISILGSINVRGADLDGLVKLLEKKLERLARIDSDTLKWRNEYQTSDGKGGWIDNPIEFSIKKRDLISLAKTLAEKARSARKQGKALCFLGH